MRLIVNENRRIVNQRHSCKRILTPILCCTYLYFFKSPKMNTHKNTVKKGCDFTLKFESVISKFLTKLYHNVQGEGRENRIIFIAAAMNFFRWGGASLFRWIFLICLY